MNVEKFCPRHGITEHRAFTRKNRLSLRMTCIKCYKDGMLKKTATDKERVKSNKLLLISTFGYKCMDCKKTFHWQAMDFHHRNRATKDSEISGLMRHELTEAAMDEINKCDLLCKCCHRKRHHKEDEKSANPVNTYTKMLKKLLVKAFGGKCLLCGIEDEYIIYDFHHINPKTKIMGISHMMKYHSSISDTVSEAKKCAMLCACCHAEVHAENLKIEEKEYMDIKIIEAYKEGKAKKHSSCKACGKEVARGAKHCKAHCIQEKKVPRPSLEELMTFLSENSYLAAGRKYGVSDNAIRKWLRTMNKVGATGLEPAYVCM